MADSFKILFAALGNLSSIDTSKVEQLDRLFKSISNQSSKIQGINQALSRTSKMQFDNISKLSTDISKISTALSRNYSLRLNVDAKGLDTLTSKLAQVNKVASDISNKKVSINVGSTSSVDSAKSKLDALKGAQNTLINTGKINLAVGVNDSGAFKAIDSIANLAKTPVKLRVEVDTSQISRATKQIKSQQNTKASPSNFSQSSGSAFPARTGRADATADGIVAAGSIASVANASVDLFKRFNTLRDLSIDVVKTASKDSKDIESTYQALGTVLKTTTLSLQDYKFASVEAAKANIDIATSTGAPTEQFVNFVKVLEAAAASTGKSAEELTPKLIRSANTINSGFAGLKGAERVDAITASIERTIAAANALEDQGGGGFKAAEVLNFGQRFGGVGGSANASEEQVAALGATALQSRSGAEALATAWERVFLEVKNAGNGTDKANAAFEALGFNAVELRKAFRADGFTATLDVLRAISKLPLTDQGKVISDLLGGGLDANQASIITEDLTNIEGRLATNAKIARQLDSNKIDLAKITDLERTKLGLQQEQTINAATVALDDTFNAVAGGFVGVFSFLATVFNSVSKLPAGLSQLAQGGLVLVFIAITATIVTLGRSLAAQFFTLGKTLAGFITAPLATASGVLKGIFSKIRTDANKELSQVGQGGAAGMKAFEFQAKLSGSNVSNALKAQFSSINIASQNNSDLMIRQIDRWKLRALQNGREVRASLSSPINTSIIASGGSTKGAGVGAKALVGASAVAGVASAAGALSSDESTKKIASTVETVSIAAIAIGSVMNLLGGAFGAFLKTGIVVRIAASIGTLIGVLAAFPVASIAVIVSTLGGLYVYLSGNRSVPDAMNKWSKSLKSSADELEIEAYNTANRTSRAFKIISGELSRAGATILGAVSSFISNAKSAEDLKSVRDISKENSRVESEREIGGRKEAQKIFGTSNFLTDKQKKFAEQSSQDRLLKGNESREFNLKTADEGVARLVAQERARNSEQLLKERAADFRKRALETRNLKATNASVADSVERKFSVRLEVPKGLEANLKTKVKPPLVADSIERKFGSKKTGNPFSFPIPNQAGGAPVLKPTADGLGSIISPFKTPSVAAEQDKSKKDQEKVGDLLVSVKALNQDQQNLINALETNVEDIQNDLIGVQTSIKDISGLKSLGTVDEQINKLKDLFRERQISQDVFLERVKPLVEERQKTSNKIREIIDEGQKDAFSELDRLLAISKTENDKVRIKNTRASLSNESANARQKITKSTAELDKFIADVANDITSTSLDERLSQNSKQLARDIASIKRVNVDGNRTALEDKRINESIAALEIAADLESIKIIDAQIKKISEQLSKNGLSGTEIQQSPIIKDLLEKKVGFQDSSQDKAATASLQRTKDSSLRKITDSISNSLSGFNPFEKDDDGQYIGIKGAFQKLKESIGKGLQEVVNKDIADLFKTEFNSISKGISGLFGGGGGTGNIITDIGGKIRGLFGKGSTLPASVEQGSQSTAISSVVDGLLSDVAVPNNNSVAIDSMTKSLSGDDCCAKIIAAINTKDAGQNPVASAVDTVVSSLGVPSTPSSELDVNTLIGAFKNGGTGEVDKYIGAIQNANGSFLEAFSLFGSTTTQELSSGITSSLNTGVSNLGSSLSGLLGNIFGGSGGSGGFFSGLFGGAGGGLGGWEGLIAGAGASLLGGLLSRSKDENKQSFATAAGGVFDGGGGIGVRSVNINNLGSNLSVQQVLQKNDVINIVVQDQQRGGAIAKSMRQN